MTDVFVSYSSEDKLFAEFLHRHFLAEGIDVFTASVSLKPGEGWSQAILKNLRSASWVFLLASRAACRSPYVQQEMGAALITQKKLIPIVWDMSPSELPGWIDQIHALNIAGENIHQVQARLTDYAKQIKNEKLQSGVVAALLFAGLFLIAKG